MPNLIHSLDAASLTLLIESLFNNPETSKNITNFYSIHDCFAVTVDKVDYLINNLKSVYTNIYIDNNYIEKFHNNIIHNLKIHYPHNINEDNTKLLITNDTTPFPRGGGQDGITEVTYEIPNLFNFYL